jgi:hypothetical protein
MQQIQQIWIFQECLSDDWSSRLMTGCYGLDLNKFGILTMLSQTSLKLIYLKGLGKSHRRITK